MRYVRTQDPGARRRLRGRAWGLRLVLLVIATPGAAGWLGCGGGSPADVVLPQDVDVSLVQLAEPVSGSVRLELAAANRGDLSLQVLAFELQDVTGVAFELRFDPALLEFTGVGPGTFYGPAAVQGAEVVEVTPGRLVGGAAQVDQTTGLSGSGSLVTLLFRLRQLRDAETVLAFGFPQSQLYRASGMAGQDVFTDAQLVTRIRTPR